MKKILAALLLGSAFAVSAAQWEYAGRSIREKRELIHFFDSKSIRYQNNNSFVFWLKVIDRQEMDVERQKNHKHLNSDALKKLKSGYKPHLLIFKYGVDSNMSLDELLLTGESINQEMFANEGFVQQRDLISVEVYCDRWESRITSILEYKNDGSINRVQGGKVYPILPESNIDYLAGLLCKSN